MSKTLTLDMKQLMEIFEAGVARGEDEQSSYDWGTSASGTRKEKFADAIYETVNAGLTWDDPRKIDRITIRDEWLKDIT
jgi:hypothetical protein